MHNLMARVPKIIVLLKQKPTLKMHNLCSTNIKKNNFPNNLHQTEFSSLTSASASMMGVQMGETFKLG
jgi:hypothetical protein